MRQERQEEQEEMEALFGIGKAEQGESVAAEDGQADDYLYDKQLVNDDIQAIKALIEGDEAVTFSEGKIAEVAGDFTAPGERESVSAGVTPRLPLISAFENLLALQIKVKTAAILAAVILPLGIAFGTYYGIVAGTDAVGAMNDPGKQLYRMDIGSPSLAAASASPSPTDQLPPTASAASATEFRLAAGQAGFVQVGKTVESLREHYASLAIDQDHDNGRPYSVVKIYSAGAKVPSLEVNCFPADENGVQNKIAAIQVYDEQYKTIEGFGVNSLLGDLRRAGMVTSVQYADSSFYVLVKELGMKFELDLSASNLPAEWLNGGDLNSLPDNMKVRSILVF
ncbi:MAG TPA: hypothetical protein PKA28_19350 [Methylomusa anaerophila]|uniref:Uncharacterized protein n=1 Tax=Methylomusa anaerophila TaxID=1930071 RepID=A0A348AQX6_9FIRM|nr:hypothetical protein [Methylomusa anaerophila]BBB93474.1 hypothetical protein MAMMFC1_04191 [Methylomusa anaerophila]HML90592.1 hypothetical protein [Methylomusa anaerophila]